MYDRSLVIERCGSIVGVSGYQGCILCTRRRRGEYQKNYKDVHLRDESATMKTWDIWAAGRLSCVAEGEMNVYGHLDLGSSHQCE